MADSARSIAEDDALTLSQGMIDEITAAAESGQRANMVELLDELHPADVADLLEQVKPRLRDEIISLWGADFDIDVIPEVEEGVRDALIENLPETKIAEAVRDLENDDVVYLVEDLEAAEQAELLEVLEESDKAAVLASLQFPEDTAGRMMQRAFVMAPTHWTVGHVIDHMRDNDNLPDEFYDIVMVDPRLRPVGTVSLSQVMANRRDVALARLMKEEFRTLKTTQSREDVGYAFAQYHLVSAPVLDEDGRLVGMINIDDAVEAMEEETHEDMMRLAGLDAEEELTDTIWETTKQRFPWLLINLITAVLASLVIAIFSDTIEAVVALAVLMPIVASMGGNGGTQSLTVAVRAIATRDISGSNALRIVRREGMVGLLNGAAFAVVIGIAVLFWYGSVTLAMVLGVAMIGTMMVAGLAGILVPLGLARMGVDPALAAGAFVTTVTDVVGFLLFLGLAAALLL